MNGLCINTEEGYEYLEQLTKDDIKRIKNKPSIANINVFLRDILSETSDKYENKEFTKDNFKLELELKSVDSILVVQRDVEKFGLEDYISIDEDKVTVDLKILEVFSY